MVKTHIRNPYLQGCDTGERARVNEPCLNCHPAFVCVSVSVLCGGLLPRPRAFQHPTQETRKRVKEPKIKKTVIKTTKESRGQGEDDRSQLFSPCYRFMVKKGATRTHIIYLKMQPGLSMITLSKNLLKKTTMRGINDICSPSLRNFMCNKI